MPKGLLSIGGRPVLQYLLERLRWKGPTALITAPGREHPPGWELFDAEWTDPTSGLGPLRGVLTALENAKTPVVLVTTVDMPGIGQEQLEWLVARLHSKKALGVMCRRGDGIEPFPMACWTDAISLVRPRLEPGRLSVHRLAEDPGFAVLDAPGSWHDSVWTNLNHREELDRFIHEVGDGG